MLISTFNVVVVLAFVSLILSLLSSFVERTIRASRAAERYVQKIMLIGCSSVLFFMAAFGSGSLSLMSETCQICKTEENVGMTIGLAGFGVFGVAMMVVWAAQWLGEAA